MPLIPANSSGIGIFDDASNPGGAPVATNGMSDNRSGSATSLYSFAFPMLLGNAAGTADRGRGNDGQTLLASAARTATTSSADQTNYNGRGVCIVTSISAEAGVTTLTLTVQGKDSISSLYYDLITGIVVYNATTDTPTVTRAVVLYPGTITADAIGLAGAVSGTTQKSVILPRIWRATITPSDASSQTYSVSAVTLV